jgi:hypothetical protein
LDLSEFLVSAKAKISDVDLLQILEWIFRQGEKLERIP